MEASIEMTMFSKSSVGRLQREEDWMNMMMIIFLGGGIVLDCVREGIIMVWYLR